VDVRVSCNGVELHRNTRARSRNVDTELYHRLRKTSYILAVILLAGATMFPLGVQLEYFQVENQGQEFVVSWKSVVEDDVRVFELTHRTALSSDEQFTMIFAPEAHGPSKIYSFRDNQVYKSGSEKLDYQLWAVYKNGVREIVATKSVNYTSTAVRRTWGSLKAMFQ
jgi:hypothetical protein